ncbi:MAG: molybdate ABC transporter substrate-binding protein [Rhodanobacter sp.]|nr:MAG: molybdate ABC transporter substrate-binding protein [Rhodanobacter sp.]TAM02094.1 MAG: molybdate ABC transporter substrate-binding protein [Rhodanobacter sp.]TAM38471.1 MAG: molybdate ABC transporter substrate-binding protein [Rhodanobacter sp.]TAN27037.1 MAG: molybdate ABC transporter substrate-binding protein [Rhodanobacter sp.]
MPLRRLLLSLLAIVGLLAWPSSRVAIAAAPAGQARLAVAANFTRVARLLADQYAHQSGSRIEISAASTGKLYAQIRHGAPFDILLAADNTTPQRLVDEGLAVRSSLYDYATGRLVLWSRDPTLITDGERVLRQHDFHKFAIANPELAPYGAAARAVLRHVGRWDALKPRLVLGENVGQATEFVISGNAKAGLLPRSLVMQAQRQMGGSSWLVPASWHPPITQSAVLLNHGRGNPAAIGFLRYLRSAAARRIIAAHGYD